MSRPDETCPVTGKICYSKPDATRAATAARGRTLGERITKYHCDDWRAHPSGAGHYHIGHRPRVNTRRRRRYKMGPL